MECGTRSDQDPFGIKYIDEDPGVRWFLFSFRGGLSGFLGLLLGGLSLA